MSVQPLLIDGSVLEGGGQILRNALSLSCILGKPIKICNIRAGRPKPGLSAQHVAGVQLLKEICDATVTGDYLGSTELEFRPCAIKSGTYTIDTKTAGSVTLLLQVALPVVIFAKDVVTLHLKGGTNAAMAPQIDFISEIFRPNLERFGASFDLDLHRRGYFPKGKGHCEITVQPIKQLSAVTLLDQGSASKIFGWSFVAGCLPQKVAHEMTDGAMSLLQRKLRSNIAIDIQSYKEDSDMAPDNCSGIVLGCETTSGCIIGGSALGSRAENPSLTGEKAAQEIVHALDQQACVDDHVQDQLVIFMTLANGKSELRTGELSLHTQTAIHIAESVGGVKFNAVKQDNGAVILECTGLGVKNPFL